VRTLDLAACSVFPAGTHFIWHVCNATVLYVLLQTAIGGTDKIGQTDKA